MGQTTVNQFVVFILGSNSDFKPAQQQKESVIGSGMQLEGMHNGNPETPSNMHASL